MESQEKVSEKSGNFERILSGNPGFTLQTSDYEVFFFLFLCRFSVIGDVIQKVQRHHDLIKAVNVYQATCSDAFNMRGN